MSKTKIEWCEETWNPVAGCSIVSPGCKNCYAMRMAARLEAMGQKKYAGLTEKRNGHVVWTGKINLDADALTIPLKTRKPAMWFVNSMSDLFHEGVPFEFVDRVFAVMALCPQHTFQILTKRPDRMAEYLNRQNITVDYDDCRSMVYHAMVNTSTPNLSSDDRRLCFKDISGGGSDCWPLPNVWLGTSCEDQQRADERIPHLLKCPAAVRFLSCEPLIGPVNLHAFVCGECGKFFTMKQSMKALKVKCPHCEHCDEYATPVHRHVLNQGMSATCNTFRDEVEWAISWVIVGGESGPRARPSNIGWIRSIVDQCKAASVPCFVKQLGANPYQTRDEGAGMRAVGVGLKDSKGGDIDEFPEDLRVREFPEPATVGRSL